MIFGLDLISRSNIEILRENFNFGILEKIEPAYLPDLISSFGRDCPDRIILKKNRKKYKKFFIYDAEGRPIYFIKHLWEYGACNEVFGIDFALNIFDPELVPDFYIFGIEKKRNIPFMLYSFVEGEPVPKKDWEPYAYELGRQFQLHHILSLYDCDLRHFLVKNGRIKRIDFGLTFYHLESRYRGFEEYMPKGLPYLSEFWAGYESEGGRIGVMLLNTRKLLEEKLEVISNIREDDFFNTSGRKLVSDLKKYWKREKLPILEDTGREKHYSPIRGF